MGEDRNAQAGATSASHGEWEAPSATLACEFRDELQVRGHRMIRCQEAQSVEVS
jgi:hypothetical protein